MLVMAVDPSSSSSQFNVDGLFWPWSVDELSLNEALECGLACKFSQYFGINDSVLEQQLHPEYCDTGSIVCCSDLPSRSLSVGPIVVPVRKCIGWKRRSDKRWIRQIWYSISETEGAVQASVEKWRGRTNRGQCGAVVVGIVQLEQIPGVAQGC